MTNLSTSEVLEKYAPSLVQLDKAERDAHPAPWKLKNSGWVCEGEGMFRFNTQYRDGAFHEENAVFIYEARWSTRAALDTLAQTLLKLERAKEALREIKKNIHVEIDLGGYYVDHIEINETREKLVEKYGFHASFPSLDEFIDFILSYIEERKE